MKLVPQAFAQSAARVGRIHLATPAGAGARLPDHGACCGPGRSLRRSIRSGLRNTSTSSSKSRGGSCLPASYTRVTAMPASYLPHLFVLKLPEIMLVLGTGRHGRSAFVPRAQRELPLNRRANFVLVTVWPHSCRSLVAMLAHPAFYNGLRHFVFVVPPFAALGGLAGALAFRARTSRSERSRPPRSPLRPLLAALALADQRHGAAASLSVHGLQLGIGRRPHGARQLHARLLGTRIQTGRRSALRAKLDANAPQATGVDDAGPSRSAGRSGRQKWRSGLTSKQPGTANARTSP